MYQVINNLPIDYAFQSKTKDELKLYGTWFNENKEIRLNHLIEYVKSTPNYEHWNANFTSESLKQLGKWLKENIETEKIPQDEYDKKRAEIPSYIELNDWDLTIKTRSILVDVGIYFGETFIHTHVKYKWEQYFSKVKRDVDNGHIIIKLKTNDLNPIWIILNVGLGLAKEKKDENCLYNLFKVWEDYL